MLLRKRFMLHSNKVRVEIGARGSPLSKAQINEIYAELTNHHPDVEFIVHEIATTGDKDKETSLRTMGKTDFFTKEIDEWVLEKEGRVGIHSAKDLSDPLRNGLALYCLTRGVDAADVLVLREGETLEGLPVGAWIATSSPRREEAVRELRSDLNFRDLRGTIGERLAMLDGGKADGVVVAEAALIRLGLTHLNRIRLPKETVEGQGRLAVVGRGGEMQTKRDREMQALFACLDASSIK